MNDKLIGLNAWIPENKEDNYFGIEVNSSGDRTTVDIAETVKQMRCSNIEKSFFESFNEEVFGILNSWFGGKK